MIYSLFIFKTFLFISGEQEISILTHSSGTGQFLLLSNQGLSCCDSVTPPNFLSLVDRTLLPG